MSQHREIIERLTIPLPLPELDVRLIEENLTAGSPPRLSSGIAVPYIRAESVISRLSAVVPGDYHITYTTEPGNAVRCELTVRGQTVSGYGSAPRFCDSVDTLKAAESDALKRAATRLGIGLDLRTAEHISVFDSDVEIITTHDGPHARFTPEGRLRVLTVAHRHVWAAYRQRIDLQKAADRWLEEVREERSTDEAILAAAKEAAQRKASEEAAARHQLRSQAPRSVTPQYVHPNAVADLIKPFDKKTVSTLMSTFGIRPESDGRFNIPESDWPKIRGAFDNLGHGLRKGA